MVLRAVCVHTHLNFESMGSDCYNSNGTSLVYKSHDVEADRLQLLHIYQILGTQGNITEEFVPCLVHLCFSTNPKGKKKKST